MIGTHPDTLSDIEFRLDWKSECAVHADIVFRKNLNFWRDLIPRTLFDRLMDKEPGDSVSLPVSPGELTPAHENRSVLSIDSGQFDRKFHPKTLTQPRYGRFYPKGMLKGIGGIYPQNMTPFRCGAIENGRITVDLNHPLAQRSLKLTATVHDVRKKPLDRGGSCIELGEAITDCVGMQSRLHHRQTDFFSDNPFERQDTQSDDLFYRPPRMVSHIDETARAMIARIYGTHLKPEMRVLDLMSSWQSHLPDTLMLSQVTGLGMNIDELQSNARLTDYLIHDLNRSPELPFDSEAYDAVVCTVSVEYLTHPVAVFEEIGRVLSPGGLFLVTFSNRWFPPKVVKIWQDIHEFERMGLVIEYFNASGRFENLSTLSIRGYPRPETDKYFGQLFYSDPVYAVWGHRIAR